MFTLRVAALRRLALSSSKLLYPSLIFAPSRDLRLFGTTLPLAKNHKKTRNKHSTAALSNNNEQVSTQTPPISEEQLVLEHVRDRHTALLEVSLGIVVLDRAPYDKVISNSEIREALVETGRLLMSTGVDPADYSPRLLMTNPMVHEQVYKIDNMLDTAGINPVYMLRAIRIFRDNPRAIRIRRNPGSGSYSRNGATGEMEEIDIVKLENVTLSTKLGKAFQSDPKLRLHMTGKGAQLMSHGVDPINPDDYIVEHPELLQKEEFDSSLKHAGLTRLDLLESTFAIQSAMSTVEWTLPDDSEPESLASENESKHFSEQSAVESYLEVYSKALIVASLEINAPSATSYDAVLGSNQSLKKQMIDTGRFLIAHGINRDTAIPTMAETQRNAPVMKKLLELHYGFQTRLMCPIDLLVNVRKAQELFIEPHIGSDNWQEIDDDRMSGYDDSQPFAVENLINGWWRARQLRE